MKLPFEEIKKEIIVKKEVETDEKYGSKPKERPTKEIINYGIVNIDKPSGPSSHQVSDYLQKILNIDKAGHSGTLDPKVTGVLPIALGRATKVVEYLLKAGKEYIAIMHLHKPVEEKLVKKIFKEFTGKISQLPPVKSSVKRQERTRTIYYMEILEIEKQDVLFKVGCEAGTYIRKLCHDIGKKLEVGAHMAELRRTKAGIFEESEAITIYDLEKILTLQKLNKKEGLEPIKEELKRVIIPAEEALQEIMKRFDIRINKERLKEMIEQAEREKYEKLGNLIGSRKGKK